MKKHKIKVPLYFQILNVVVCKNFVKGMKKLKIAEYPNFKANSYDSFVTFHKDEIYVFIHKDTSIKIIAHEAVHIANEVFKQVHVTLDLNNDEPYAYLLGWIVGEITKVQKK